MSDVLTRATVLVLNRNWQAIHVRTPQNAFCMMATNVATGLEIEGEDQPSSAAVVQGVDGMSGDTQYWTAPQRRRVDIRPVTWDEWLRLPIREQDECVHTVRGFFP